ncbi:hypothetical protein V8D89_009476 [Ganoderma adspersum]
MANIPNQLQVHVLHAASSVSYLLPWILFLVLVILLTVLSVLVVIRLTGQVTELVHANAALQRRFDAREISLNDFAEASDCGHVAGAKTSLVSGDLSSQSTTTPAPAVVSESESERVQALEARLDFLRNSCNILIAQKNDLVARQNENLAMLKAQLAVTHQTKDELLAEDASCKTLLGQKNEELASINAQLAAAQRNVAAVVTERDGAVSHARTIVNQLERTRADYDDKISSLTIRATDADRNSVALQTTVQQQKTEMDDILFKNANLSAELTKVRDLRDSDLEQFRMRENNNARTIATQGVEIAMLTERLEAATRPRPTPASPRYSFQSIMYRRSNESESESESSFDSEKPSPPRWRRFSIRLPRKSGKL